METLGNHPPDSSAVIAAIEVQVLFDGLGDGPRVLDDLPVHVHNVKATIGPILEMHRPEPGVSRGQKLDVLFIGRTTCHPTHPVGVQHLPMDQVAPGITDEDIVHKLRTEGISAVHRRSGRTREIAGDTASPLDHAGDDATDAPTGPDYSPRLIRADPEHLSRGPIGCDADPRGRQSDPGIARGMRPVHGHPLEMIAVARHEAIAHRIEGEAILAATGLRTDRLGGRIQAEIQPPQIQPVAFRARRSHTVTSVGSGGPVEAVIQPPIEGIEERLDIEPGYPAAESAHHDTALIGPTVARGVLEPHNIRRGSDVEPAPGTNEGCRPGQVIGKDRGTVEAAIPIEILEHSDPPGMRGFIPPLGIIDHLSHERAAVLVESHGHRTHHLGLTGRQF